jgi:glycosyltransferase involved in cell wall biosynthesis
MRIAIATDAWYPQPNGVVRVLGCLHDRLAARGHELLVVSPDRFSTIPCPTYAEIPLALFPGRGTARLIEDFAPDAIHVATEGPIGQAARRFCRRAGLPFTTAYHTKFPEYLAQRTRLPVDWFYGYIRHFHRPSRAVMVPSSSVYSELARWRFANLRQWSHGVDTRVFHPQPKDLLDYPRPIFMYVGRVTVDKNLPAFLDLDLPGTKVVVGSGPLRERLIARYPDVRFHIARGDADLSRHFAAADAFVFPSRTDTFGLVMLEALASGVPVAAFPVAGPLDVIGESGAGILSENLREAALAALDIPSDRCVAHAARFSWERVTDQFLSFLHPIG